LEELGGIKTVFAGYSNGIIRKWDLYSGNCILHIQT
jgi:hypothetical protein